MLRTLDSGLNKQLFKIRKFIGVIEEMGAEIIPEGMRVDTEDVGLSEIIK